MNSLWAVGFTNLAPTDLLSLRTVLGALSQSRIDTHTDCLI